MANSSPARLFLCVFGLLVSSLSPLQAQIKTSAQQVLLLDLSTDQVLLQKNADEPAAPSSMVKLMTVYILFEELKAGRVKLDDTFTVSKKAVRRRGSRMRLEAEQTVKIEDLIRGIIIQSGNDAAIVVAENLAGSEADFAKRMNETAARLGLTASHFTNATGWHDAAQYMSARDIAMLARRTIEDFPDYYAFYAERSFKYGKRKSQANRNPLLYRPRLGADGLKTGYTRAGGYGLAASAVRGGRRLLLVVNGLKSVRSRASESERLLKWGFRNFANYALYRARETVSHAEVWLGRQESVPLLSPNNIVASLPKRGRRDMTVTVVYDGPIPAPIRKGDTIAKLVVRTPKSDPLEFPLVAGADVPPAGLFGRITTSLRLLLEDAFK